MNFVINLTYIVHHTPAINVLSGKKNPRYYARNITPSVMYDDSEQRRQKRLSKPTCSIAKVSKIKRKSTERPRLEQQLVH